MYIKRFFAVIIGVMSIFSMASAQTQGTLRAVLKDATNEDPIPFATVSISKHGSSKPYKYALSSADGKVAIEKVTAGKYVFRAELLGYKTYALEPIHVAKHFPDEPGNFEVLRIKIGRCVTHGIKSSNRKSEGRSILRI